MLVHEAKITELHQVQMSFYLATDTDVFGLMLYAYGIKHSAKLITLPRLANLYFIQSYAAQ